MRKLSKHISELRPSYDVVIIGSGYGGSIAAARFARAGLQVCLLEKGKEMQPGDFPDNMSEAAKEMQVNADSRTATGNGLYEFHISEDITVFKGCGLGGTSLVNANVAIKPVERVFEDTRWPTAIRNDRKSLEEGYGKAAQVLAPQPYPVNAPGYPELAKTKALKKSAAAMKEPFSYVDINVSFADGPNSVGYEQHKCNNCGDCVTGCNHGAKNMLIMNYLPDAVNHGAEIFCNVDAKYVERSGDDWLVYFDLFHACRDVFNAPLLFVRATKLVIVAGGALGSTEFLLRSKEKGLSVSPMLGKHFTGNGDVLGFGYNCCEPINGMGKGSHFGDAKLKPVGPCITGVIDMRDKPNLADGMTFEEGSIPGPIASFVSRSLLGLTVLRHLEGASFWDKMKATMRRWVSEWRGPYYGATNNMQTYLIMSHDDGNGEMNLKKGRLNIEWKDVGRQPIFEKASKAMEDATKALSGVYVKDVVWNKELNYKLITVHPLGGCCMGDSASTGVTNHIGNVFTGSNGTTHPGLHVLDGSIVPLPLGTNPLFTISAVTERACKIIIQQMGLQATEDYPPIHLADVGYVPAVQFTETMKGFFSTKETDDFEKAYEAGKQEDSPFQFTLTIKTGDINVFSSNPGHPGSMVGTVIAPALSDKPMTISNGVFNLFVKDANNPLHKKMKYSMQLNTHDGKHYFFDGYKQVEHDKHFDMWSDTSTLYITVYNGTNTTGTKAGVGILKIAPGDFAKQMTTMKAVDTKNKWESIKALEKFSMFFSKNIIDTYIKPVFGNIKNKLVDKEKHEKVI
ncbi:GMC family oxidoreductase [Ilyomonas limi]|uniref:Cholesterol oxidase n=1 Tax=Ilyomonas limi TaxID=2575867 RepID=A0A4U3L950_9BACT|nr:GMC family oxidoreductase N-terminal domain-containing protein [Ilyomonas limi]TKK71851.1 GMC family oxidoreductase [Ilyomonas limi]